MNRTAEMHFGKWRTEVWSSAAADLSLLPSSLVDSMAWQQGPGRCLLAMMPLWCWEYPRCFVATFPEISQFALVFCELVSAGKGSGPGMSPEAESPPGTHQLGPAKTNSPRLLSTSCSFKFLKTGSFILV